MAKTRWGTSQYGHKAHLPNTADTGMAVRLSGQCLTCRFTEDPLCSLQGCCHPRPEACLDKVAPRPRRSRKSLEARSWEILPKKAFAPGCWEVKAFCKDIWSPAFGCLTTETIVPKELEFPHTGRKKGGCHPQEDWTPERFHTVLITCQTRMRESLEPRQCWPVMGRTLL